MKKIDFVTIRCPDCNYWLTRAYLTRYNKELHEIERYHLCLKCGSKFRSTQELSETEEYPPKSAA